MAIVQESCDTSNQAPAEDLAERYWDMYLKRDRVEEEVAPGLAASAVRGEDAR